MFVSRCTFIYHYFPSLIFAILALVYWATRFKARFPRLARPSITVYCVLVFVLFAAFYPFATGMTIPRDYADAMNWFKALRLPWWPFPGWLMY